MTDSSDLDLLQALEYLGDAKSFAHRIYAMIGKIELFDGFERAEIRLLSNFMHVYRAPPGAVLISEGRQGDHMMLLVDGSVEILKRDRYENSKRIGTVEAGRTLGEMSMIDGEPRFATCIAMESSTFAVLTRDDLARIIDEQPRLGAKILMELVLMLSQRLRQTSTTLVNYLD